MAWPNPKSAITPKLIMAGDQLGSSETKIDSLAAL
jgi:hypothetical protein